MGVSAGMPLRAWADEPGPISLKPGQHAADEAAALELAAMVNDPNEPSETVASRTEEESQPTTQPAAPTWPPGLLQKGLDAIGLGKPMKDLGLRAYGWVESGFTGRIHGGPSRHQGGPRPPLFLRVFDGHKYNNLILNQLKFTMDRVVDTSKAIDFGARADFIYGADSRNIHSYGLMDGHSIGANPPYSNPPNPWPFNRGAQPDLQQAYAEMWIKTGDPGEGLDIIFGKWVTTMGAEVIDAPGNWLYSRSMLFGYAIPFTHTGLKLTYYFNPTNNVYFAVVRGWDVWEDNNKGASWMGGFLLSSKEQCGANPRSQFGLNVIAGPEQFSSPRLSLAYIGASHSTWHSNPGNRVVIDGVWTYRWTEKLTQIINADFGYEDDVPNAINNVGVVRKRDADWYGIAYYLNYVFNDYVSTTGRAEWFRDHYGVRTGFQGDFYEVTTGVGITPFPKDPYLKDLMIRPELRWDWSANNVPFAGKHTTDTWQMTAGIDVIFKF